MDKNEKPVIVIHLDNGGRNLCGAGVGRGRRDGRRTDDVRAVTCMACQFQA